MISRRELLIGGAATTLWACGRSASVRSNVPRITHGVQAGDVTLDTAQVWARCNEPAHMLVEWSTTESFRQPVRIAGTAAIATADNTARAVLTGLPAAQTIFYRVKFEREAARGSSEWAVGKLVTPKSDRVRLAWSGDTCGQGFGRNPEWGGLQGFASIRAAQPDLFINSGDLIYADNPIVAANRTHDGRVWKNITNERVARVAQDLDDFRARFAYNFEDEHVRALAADVACIAQWDDHETRNNWWPGQTLADERYSNEKRTSTLAARALQATREWTPIGGPSINRVIHYGPLLDIFVLDLRSFRSPNDTNIGGPADMLGAAQVEWFLAELAASKARWKIVACDQPLALFIGDGPDDTLSEGYANNSPGAPLGRELELAHVLRSMHLRGIKNVVWLTADVHYAAHHAFDPARAKQAIGDPTQSASFVFDAFHEFIAGPIHAGNYGPNPLDPTFGPEVKYQFVAPVQNAAPWDGFQSFGTVDVTADAISVALVGIDGNPRYTVELPYIG